MTYVTSGDFSNSLNPDQAWQIGSPDLDSKLFDTLIVSLPDFLKSLKSVGEKEVGFYKEIIYPACKEFEVSFTKEWKTQILFGGIKINIFVC